MDMRIPIRHLWPKMAEVALNEVVGNAKVIGDMVVADAAIASVADVVLGEKILLV
jgi:hypothetical protein